MFVILAPFEERAGNDELCAAGRHARGCARSSASIPRRRSPCSARRRSKAWAAPAASSCRSRTAAAPGCEPLQGAVQNLSEGGSAEPRLAGLFSTLQRRAAAALRRHRPRKGQGAGRLARRGPRHAAGLPRLRLRQRLHLREPQLAGERAGRSALPHAGRTTSAGWRSATRTGDRVPLRTLINVKDTSGPADRQPLQALSRRPRSAAARRRASARARRSASWRRWPRHELPDTHGLRVDRADAVSRSWPARTCSPSSSSRWPWCSCSWCWRPSTKAGRCRWRSS